jgi:CYTH domain-containing protein
MGIEIERKFLLRTIPNEKPFEKIKIKQWYLKSGNRWERARSMDSEFGKRWIHTIKTRLSDMKCIEDERPLTKQEFEDFVSKCKISEGSKFISKQRFIYLDGDLKWEVDIFRGKCHLIVAEVEIPSEEYELEIPDFIKKILLMEVTGLKQFSNKNLSCKIGKQI